MRLMGTSPFLSGQSATSKMMGAVPLRNTANSESRAYRGGLVLRGTLFLLLNNAPRKESVNQEHLVSIWSKVVSFAHFAGRNDTLSYQTMVLWIMILQRAHKAKVGIRTIWGARDHNEHRIMSREVEAPVVVLLNGGHFLIAIPRSMLSLQLQGSMAKGQNNILFDAKWEGYSDKKGQGDTWSCWLYVMVFIQQLFKDNTGGEWKMGRVTMDFVVNVLKQ